MSDIKNRVTPGTVGPQGKVNQGPAVTKSKSVAVDGLGIASQSNVNQGVGKSRARLDAGTSLPEPPKTDPGLADNVANVSVGLCEKDGGKWILDMTADALSQQLFRGTTKEELESDEAAINGQNLSVGDIPPEERHRIQQSVAKMGRVAEQLSAANSEAALAEKEKLANDCASVFSKYNTSSKADAAAAVIKLDKDSGDPNSLFFTLLAAFAGEMNGGGANFAPRGFMMIQELLKQGNAASALQASAKPMAVVGAGMFRAPTAAGAGAAKPSDTRFGNNE